MFACHVHRVSVYRQTSGMSYRAMFGTAASSPAPGTKRGTGRPSSRGRRSPTRGAKDQRSRASPPPASRSPPRPASPDRVPTGIKVGLAVGQGGIGGVVGVAATPRPEKSPPRGGSPGGARGHHDTPPRNATDTTGGGLTGWGAAADGPSAVAQAPSPQAVRRDIGVAALGLRPALPGTRPRTAPLAAGSSVSLVSCGDDGASVLAVSGSGVPRSVAAAAGTSRGGGPGVDGAHVMRGASFDRMVHS